MDGSNFNAVSKTIAIGLALQLLLGAILMTAPVREENTRTSFIEDGFLKAKPVQFHSDTGEDKHNLRPVWFKAAFLTTEQSCTEGFFRVLSQTFPRRLGWLKEKFLTFLFPFHAFP